MWVSSSARGRSSPSASSSVGRHDSGPGSTSTSPTCQQPITRGRPRCMRSITLIGRGCSGSGERPGVLVARLGRLGLEVDDRRRLGVIGAVARELAFADVRGVLRLVFRKAGSSPRSASAGSAATGLSPSADGRASLRPLTPGVSSAAGKRSAADSVSAGELRGRARVRPRRSAAARPRSGRSRRRDP